MKQPGVDHVFLIAVLTIHVVWIAWVIFGTLLTRGHKFWSWFHVLSLVYGIFIEVAPVPCPLTLAEQALETRLGEAAYHGSFLQHYLEAAIYPNIPYPLLVTVAVGFCAANLGIHWRRWRKNRSIREGSTAA